MRDRGAGEKERSIDIGSERSIPFCCADIADIGIGALEGGIVDEDVELPEVLDALAHEVGAVLFGGYVARKDKRSSLRPFDPAGRFIGILVLAKIRNDDICPFAGKCDGHGAADTRICACDQRNLSLEAA